MPANELWRLVRQWETRGDEEALVKIKEWAAKAPRGEVVHAYRRDPALREILLTR